MDNYTSGIESTNGNNNNNHPHNSNNNENDNSNNKRNKRHQNQYFGDKHFHLTRIDEFDEAEWSEVRHACCPNALLGLRDILVGSILVGACICLLIFGLLLLGTGSKVLFGCHIGQMFASETGRILLPTALSTTTTAATAATAMATGAVETAVAAETTTTMEFVTVDVGVDTTTASTATGDTLARLDPIAAIMIGLLSSAMLQSSTATLRIVLELVVGSGVGMGIVGGGGRVDWKWVPYIIMGVNIGATMTNNLVAITFTTHRGDHANHLERALTGAAIHDLFNILTVLILLPIEIFTGYLHTLSSFIIEYAETNRGDIFRGPINLYLAPIVDRIIISNNKAIINVATQLNTCQSFYPIQCEEEQDGTVTYESCTATTIDDHNHIVDASTTNYNYKIHNYDDHNNIFGFSKCSKDTNICPLFFKNGESLNNDTWNGGICLLLGFIIVCFSAFGIVLTMNYLCKGLSSRVLHKVTNWNGYLCIAVGCCFTILCQSSTLVTSIMIPFIAIGIIRNEVSVPYILGSNIGASLSMLIVAIYTPGVDALHISLINTIFNCTGLMIWYPIPYMRNSLLFAAQQVGYCARVFRLFPLFYIGLLYFGCPVLLLTLSNLYTTGNNSNTGVSNGTNNSTYNNEDDDAVVPMGSSGTTRQNAWFLVLAISITIVLSAFAIGMTYFCKWRDGGSKMRHFFELYLSSLSSTKVTVNDSDLEGYDGIEGYEDEEVPMMGKKGGRGKQKNKGKGGDGDGGVSPQKSNDEEVTSNGRQRAENKTNRRGSTDYNLIPPPDNFENEDV